MAIELDRARDVIQIEIDALNEVRDSLGTPFLKAAELMLERLAEGHKLVVTGIGKNLHIAEKVSATLASTGSTSVVLNPAQAMHGDLGVLCSGDVMLVLSFSGESDEILTLLPAAARLNVTTIAVTGNLQSRLAVASDMVIPVPCAREACPFNMAPTASTTATLALGDALAMVLLHASGFDREDYAKLHPAGAIGRALLLKVKDIMRTGDRLAVVTPECLTRDAILAMSTARSGSVIVTHPDHTLAGIFTDGDLRRHMVSDPELLTRPIGDVMSVSPTHVTEDELAVKVLHIFEEREIDDLPVVNANGQIVGAVDIQDLPKFKVM
jgi:arabinose-5-phosphate isomerase